MNQKLNPLRDWNLMRIEQSPGQRIEFPATSDAFVNPDSILSETLLYEMGAATSWTGFYGLGVYESDFA